MIKRQNENKIVTKGKIIIGVITIILLLGLMGVYALFFMPNFRSDNFRDYFLFDNETITVQDDQYKNVVNNPIIEDDIVYISFQYIKENIDKYIYWDEALEKLTITTSNDVLRFQPDTTIYMLNDQSFKMNVPIQIFDDEVYLPNTLLESVYNITLDYIPETDIVVVNNLTEDWTYGTLKRNTILRYEPNKKGVIEDKLKKGEIIQIFDEYDNYTKIVDSYGKVGYIRTKDINKKSIELVAGIEPDEDEYKTTPIDYEINLVWDLITNEEASSLSSKKMNEQGVNILCPTWFKFDREKLDGTIISYADKEYVDYAHQNGDLVWGLISDVADAYDTVVLENILPNTDYRDTAIRQLLWYMEEYDLDGINVDFEVLPVDCSEDYVQFFRELYPYMKKAGKHLSVDTYVPSDWSTYFRREDVVQSVDYFIIMAYDEYNASTDAGPVASYDFVEQGILDSLDIIPKEKLILGMPFYTRVWKSYIEDDSLISQYAVDLGMDTAKQQFDNNNAVYSYDDDYKYNYGEYTTIEDGNTVTYKAWLEDSDSIKDKVELANKYDLKGVAGWSRGLQGQGVFELIDETLEK